jgi:hypothetical protein
LPDAGAWYVGDCAIRADNSGYGGGGDMNYPYDLGPYSRTVTTCSADAQRSFDRGLNWCFGYHHEEAVACFEKALESDPNCAMAHWVGSISRHSPGVGN